MKAIKFIASLFVSATVLSTAIAGNAPKKAAEGLAVDTKGSKIHWLAKKVTGQHEGFISISNGNLSVAKGKVTGGTFTIDMKSIVCTDITDAEYNKKFIGHITSGDFFEIEKFPTASFVITKVAGKQVTGNLTVKGITKSITFPAEISVKGGKLNAKANITIDRTDFNIKYGSKKFFDSIGDKAIYDDFALTVSLVSE